MLEGRDMHVVLIITAPTNGNTYNFVTDILNLGATSPSLYKDIVQDDFDVLILYTTNGDNIIPRWVGQVFPDWAYQELNH